MSNTSIALTVAVVAAIPGLLGVYYSFRTRKDQQQHTATEFGTQLAQEAFKTMADQLARLTVQQREWDGDREAWQRDRDGWNRDRTSLLQRIDLLSERMHRTNYYLQLLLLTLDQHQIERPELPAPPPMPPDDWTLGG